MKYYIIAGEASGDLHGSNLIKALKARDANADIRCWGGDKMEAEGGNLVRHIRDLAFMGFAEVVKHLPTILNNLSFCKKDILSFNPDVVILIDYPGFNFRLFEFIKQHHFRLFYYISPQLWAWKTGRVRKVKKYVDRMFVIFPFEKEFYAKHGVEVDFVGHPLLDELKPTETLPKYNDFNTSEGRDLNKEVFEVAKTIALLPGSRKQEIAKLLPEYLKVIPDFPEYKFVIAGISGLGLDFYQSMTADSRCEIEWDNTYGLLSRSTAAIVTSGTATLETALYNVPEVICYKASPLSYLIAKQLIKGIEYICIVNLIANRKIVTELIQQEVNRENLKQELRELIEGKERKAILDGYEEVRQLLGESGASGRTADLMISYLQIV